jgi:hypothetical protein
LNLIPFLDEGQCPTWETATNNFECSNIDKGLEFAIKGMKMPGMIFLQYLWIKIPSPLKELTEKVLAQKGRIEGERRQVTVMFCDLEGSTALTENFSSCPDRR